MATKRKHSSCTIKEKLDILKRLDKGESASKIALELGVGKATISDWKKNRAKIEKFSGSTSEEALQKRHNSSVSAHDRLDEAVFLWFSQERQKGVPISGPLIQEKALQLNERMNGSPSFVASNGWLNRWKNRHGVRQLAITGEKLSSDVTAAEAFALEFKDTITDNYSPQQIYNADESGLNFKSLPNKSLASNEEACAPGFKMNKQRLTVMACCNVVATNKLPLMVIGNSKKPRALKDVNMDALPVYYRNQKKAWMNSALFKEWFEKQFVPSVTKFNEEVGLPNRALLFLDNASSHPSEKELTCGEIRAVFLPPNVTPLLQPMDQGVLQFIKLYYRKHLVRTLLSDEESSITDILKRITIKDVIYWVAEAWDNCPETLIKKSWKKLWPDLQFEETQHFQAPLQNDLLDVVQKLPGCEEAGENDVIEWVGVDDNGHQEYNDEEIVNLVQPQSPNEDEESEEEISQPDRVSHADATKALDVALRYVEQSPAALPADVMFMRRWLNIAASSRYTSMRQKKVTEFFKNTP